MGSICWHVSKHQFSCFASCSVHVVTVKLSTNNDAALFKRRFSEPWYGRGLSLDMGEVCPLMQSQSDENMLLNILIHRPIHNVAEPILLTVLERQLKQQVSTRGHLTEVWVGVCRRGLQTLTLFKTKSVHFATLFKTRDLYILLMFCVFLSALFFISHSESIFFYINDIIELDLKRMLVPTCRVQGFQSRNTPRSKKSEIVYPVKTQDPENHTLLSSTYPFRPTWPKRVCAVKGVPSPGILPDLGRRSWGSVEVTTPQPLVN